MMLSPRFASRIAHLPRGLRDLVVRPRLFLTIVVAVVTMAGLRLMVDWKWPTVLLAAWNLAVAVHLVLMFAMMTGSDDRRTLARARRLDEGAGAILMVSAVAGVAALLAVVAELAVVRDLSGAAKVGHVALTASTIVAAWLFIHLTFAVHYAHAWTIALADGEPAGLDFPGGERPDYWDFVYVAFVVGTSGQTADVAFTSRRMRRIGLAHCTLAFFFNTTVLALTINIAAGVM